MNINLKGFVRHFQEMIGVFKLTHRRISQKVENSHKIDNWYKRIARLRDSQNT